MRTLTRPMFKMGGPIKEGVMHGIREPYRGGGAALVGNPVYPKTGGREHHRISMMNPMNWKNIFTGAQVAKNPTIGSKAWGGIKSLFGKTTPVTKTVPRQGPTYNVPGGNVYSKGYPGGKGIGKKIGPGSAEVTEQVWTPKGWVARDPTYQIGKKIYEGRGWFGKPIKWAGKAAATPTGAIGLTYVGGKWLWPDGKEATDAEVEAQFNFKGGKKPGRGDERMYWEDPEKAKKLARQRKDDRINDLLQTMGYDAAKKDAIGKALIDASQIVSERGTLDKKNITRELINPIIAATSKRLEKPEQLNEAVRLMMTKAEIEKEMNPLKDELTRAQIAASKKALAGKGIKEIISEAAGKNQPLTGDSLAAAARAVLPGDFKVLPLKVPKKTDTFEFIVDTVKESHTNPEIPPFPPGNYVLKERIVYIDETGKVTPLDI